MLPYTKRRLVSAILPLVLLAGLTQLFVPPASAAPNKPTRPQREPLGHAAAATRAAPPADPNANRQVTGTPKVTWPAAGTAQVSLATARPGGVRPDAVRAGALLLRDV